MLQIVYCYWPQRNHATLAKRSALPDKELWTKYSVRVLSEKGMYVLKINYSRLQTIHSHGDILHRSHSSLCDVVYVQPITEFHFLRQCDLNKFSVFVFL